MPGLRVASHNIMDGRRLGGLLRSYRRISPRLNLKVLCIQENIDLPQPACCATRGSTHDAAGAIAATLGRTWERSDVRTLDSRLTTLFDGRFFTLIAQDVVELPLLQSLSAFERTYISGGQPEQKHALFTLLRSPKKGRGRRRSNLRDCRRTPGRTRARRRTPLFIVVANAHLDAAGTNSHRAAQMGAVAAHLSSWPLRFSRQRLLSPALCVVAADTNCFEVDRLAQREALRKIMAPLEATVGAKDLQSRSNPDTHWFARTDEPNMGHKAANLLGKLGIDAPRRYDVLASNAAPALSTGTESTIDSDHDLVWAILRVTRK